jgi:hypothetical protein
VIVASGWNRLRTYLVVGFLTCDVIDRVLLYAVRLDPEQFLFVCSFLRGFTNETSRTFSTPKLLYEFLVFPVVIACQVYSLFVYFTALRIRGDLLGSRISVPLICVPLQVKYSFLGRG